MKRNSLALLSGAVAASMIPTLCGAQSQSIIGYMNGSTPQQGYTTVSPTNPLPTTGAGSTPSSPTYTKSAPWTSAGPDQTLVVTGTAQGLPSIPAGATIALLTLNGGTAVVWSGDGTTTPIGTGPNTWASPLYVTYNFTPLSNLKIILQTGSASVTIGVAYGK